MRQFPKGAGFAELHLPLAQFLVSQSTRNDVLQHATISIAALLASTDPEGQPEPTEACFCKHLQHKQAALQLLQQRIKALDINPHLSAAIAFLLMGEMGGAHSKVHMQGLKSVLKHLQSPNNPSTEEHFRFSENDDSALIWLSLAVAIRLDITHALEGDGPPILDPLPINSEIEQSQASWILRACENSSNKSKAAKWGSAIFTLRVLLHRTFHIATLAKRLRESSDRSPEQENTIQKLCSELQLELERWFQRPIIQQIVFEEMTKRPTRPDLPSFLYYDPLEIHNFGIQLIMNEYRTAILYNSLIAHPEIGPGPSGSIRFSTAVDLCRALLSLSSHTLWNRVTEGACLFQLFLCYLTFGGDDFYPLESREVLKMLAALVSNGLALNPEEMFNGWRRKCPGLPPITAFSKMEQDDFGQHDST